jgi:BirA family biotin operon repressor/biotin-[acetyl-CoA-carboxylase] ligase
MNTAPHLHWGAESLWQTLEPLLPGLSVEVLARVESTNTRLLERARASSGDPDAPITRTGELDALARAQGLQSSRYGRRQGDISPCLLVAEDQTRGRGRLGRDWVSSPGASLTFSLSLPLAPVQWGGLSLAVGLALADALDPQAAAGGAATPRIVLKWPNDLWLAEGPGRGRKLGGVLIETVSVGQRRMCVVGVGLNVRPQPALVDGLAHGYASLSELQPGITAPQALAQVAQPLVQALLRFQHQGFAPLVPAYNRRDLLRGQPVVASGGEPQQGVVEGVDETGALRLYQTPAAPGADGLPATAVPGQGEVLRIVSGEVSVRLAGG